jgi:ATP-dependent DNA helicase DinG
MVQGQLQDQVPERALYSTPVTFRAGDNLQLLLNHAGEPLLAGLDSISRPLARIRERIGGSTEDEFPAVLLQELENGSEEVVQLREGMAHLLTGDDPDGVFWVELPPDSSRPISLRYAPLEVSQRLHDDIWSRLKSSVLTSATLTAGPGPSGFEHLLRRLGLNLLPPERVKTAAFGSPFDFQRNCLVCFPGFLPSPGDDSRGHLQGVSDLCARIAVDLRRNMLILFTSFDALQRVERSMKMQLLGSGVELLVQGRSGSRERLVRQLRKTSGAVLMGTDAFWEGIDVPGEGLEVVVIVRLPFEVPGDPVVAARIDRIRERGGSPFYEYQVPNAVLKLRQGAGRLIRTATDRGAILVLDPRTVIKGYGSNFRRALPGEVIIPRDRKSVV